MTIRKTIRSTIRRPYYDLVKPGSGLNPLAYPTILKDGNTFAWYDSQDLTKITKDGSNVVSAVSDKLGGAINITSGSCTWSADDGFVFNGTDQYLRSGNFNTKSGPFTIYALIKQITFTNSDSIFDGAANSKLRLLQRTTTPNLAIMSGTVGPENSGLAVGDWGIVTSVFNGESSSIQINKEQIVSGAVTVGASVITALTLAAQGGLSTGFANCAIYEIIYRQGVDAIDTKILIQDYLIKKKYDG